MSYLFLIIVRIIFTFSWQFDATPPTTETRHGQTIGAGLDEGLTTIEFQEDGEDEEETLPVAEDVASMIHLMANFPIECSISLTNGIVTNVTLQ